MWVRRREREDTVVVIEEVPPPPPLLPHRNGYFSLLHQIYSFGFMTVAKQYVFDLFNWAIYSMSTNPNPNPRKENGERRGRTKLFLIYLSNCHNRITTMMIKQMTTGAEAIESSWSHGNTQLTSIEVNSKNMRTHFFYDCLWSRLSYFFSPKFNRSRSFLSLLRFKRSIVPLWVMSMVAILGCILKRWSRWWSFICLSHGKKSFYLIIHRL